MYSSGGPESQIEQDVREKKLDYPAGGHSLFLRTNTHVTVRSPGRKPRSPSYSPCGGSGLCGGGPRKRGPKNRGRSSGVGRGTRAYLHDEPSTKHLCCPS